MLGDSEAPSQNPKGWQGKKRHRMLRTQRLRLRAFTAGDAHCFLHLASDWDVARMTSDIPHPLNLAQSEAWLQPADGEARFAIELDGELIGGVGYFLRTSGAAELGFWLGRAYWAQGIATEAATAVIGHGFEQGGYRAFTSSHFIDNPASGRVLAKLGFEAAGEGEIWSTARGVNVPAKYVWLTRERASEILRLPEPDEQRSRWGALLGRISGRA